MVGSTSHGRACAASADCRRTHCPRTPGETWKSWEDNPYSTARGGPAATPTEFFEEPDIREAAERKLRYVLDRYGYSPHLLAVDLLNEPEWDGKNGEETGEFGYGGDDPKTFDHTHVGLWRAIFSGAGVLAHSAPPFTPDSDVLMTPERGRHFRVLSDFLSRLSLSPPLLPQLAPPATPEGTRAWVLGRTGYWALWVMGARKGYGSPVEGATVRMGVPSGKYRVTWWNDVTGEQLGSEELTAREEGLVLRLPVFVRHVAGVLEALPAEP